MPDLSLIPQMVTAPRTDSIYNCHGYLTKVPIAAIEPFILAFTMPGEVVTDFFAGSGMTGLAAIRLGRKAQLSDISALGCHIAKGYSTNVKTLDFRSAAEAVIGKARSAIGSFYTTKRSSDDSNTEMVRTVWSFVYNCPSCQSPLIYFHNLSDKGGPPKNCPHCAFPFVRRHWSRGADVPVQVVCRNKQGRLTDQDVAAFDLAMIEKASHDPRLSEVPALVIDEAREMFSRSGLGKSGLKCTSDFFAPRNAIALLELWRAINALEDIQVRDKLRFVFTAILPRASRRYQWSAQRPLNAQNQTYYIAPVYYEWNVFELFERKVEAAVRSDEVLFHSAPLLLNGTEKDLTYEIASADQLAHIKSESIDYIFTDPPFGSNIFYSDMNLFHEAWLGKTTDHSKEAVVYTTGKKKDGSNSRYEALLTGAFSEGFRILRPGRFMSIVFGNSSGQIWGLVQRAIRQAGFDASPVHVAVLDKGQRSVKGLSSGSESVVTVDLILSVQKPLIANEPGDVQHLQNGDIKSLVSETIHEISLEQGQMEYSPSHVYARILRKAIQNHYVLDGLHLSDVLLSLRDAGYTTHHKTGLLIHKSSEINAVA
jgi:16S rRNA G966 N2-methylase RsmD